MLVPRTLALLCLALCFSGCAAGLPRVIYLARHGQTEWNREARYQGDPDLDQVGYINRVSLWQLLKDRPVGAIYVSQRQRTRRTAELVAREHKLPVEERAAINEIASGIFEGICFSQMAPHLARPADRNCEVKARGSRPEETLKLIQALFREGSRDRIGGRLPQAESYVDVAKRTAEFIEELRRGHSEREVLVVGHGVVNRVLLHHLMGWPLELVYQLRQENDQVFRLEIRQEGARPQLSLYTPGVGWRVCGDPTRGAKHLDCSPQKPERITPPDAPMPPPMNPPPATQPTPP